MQRELPAATRSCDATAGTELLLRLEIDDILALKSDWQKLGGRLTLMEFAYLL